MGFFKLLRMIAGPPKMSAWQEDHRRLATVLCEVKAQVLDLDAQIGTIHLALRRHDDEIAQCKDLTDRHSKALTQLEQLVSTPPALPPARYTDRSVGTMVDAPARLMTRSDF